MVIADVSNAEIARLLRDLSDMLEIQGANPFRVRAYRNVSRVAEGWKEPLAHVAARGEQALTEIPYIGADMAAKVAEIVRTGSLAQYREEAARVPPALLELLRVPGLGPKRVRALQETLGVSSIAELDAALKAGKVRRVPGFSSRTQARLLEDVAALEHTTRRFLRAHVAVYAEALAAYLRRLAGVQRAEIAGSFRRLKDSVGDLDVLVACEASCPVVDRFVEFGGVAQVLAQGETSAAVRLNTGLQVDLRVVAAESFGAGLHYFTGSQAHTIVMRRLAQERGLKLNEYGLFDAGGALVASRTEEDINAALGLPWIPPELREDRGEFDAAREGRLPELIEQSAIRGDLQMHTTASDGMNTLERMALAAQEMGYEYVAITDHTPLLAMIQGLDREGFRKQWREIDRLNAKLSTLTILKAAEVDIHQDGSLDLDDETLSQLDLVVVSLHSKLALPPDAQTRRVIRALQNPHVDIMGHPRGRKLFSRDGAQFDLAEVCRVAAHHGVMMEINAQPDRLDLSDGDIRVALDSGCRVVISTDAHSTRDLAFMRWGVDHARRGWVRAADVANTLPLHAFRQLLHGARSRS